MSLIACLQLRCTSDLDRNWATFEALARAAAANGAKLIASPEATDYLGPHDQKMQIAESIHGPRSQRYGALAAELGVDILVGSVAESYNEDRCYNTSLYFDHTGQCIAHYQKIHLFDVDLSASGGVRFAESARTEAGTRLVCAQGQLGVVGLSICFDLRFPELYQRLTAQGATILAVPSAFTERTGRDHWHALLKARAIENQAYVIAPGQWGEHDDNGLRCSYGHSLIVDPWGTILAECGDGEGYCLAPIDLDRLHTIRAQIPMQANRRL